MSEQPREPIFNAPAIVIGLIGLFALVHVGRTALDPIDDDLIVGLFAFIPARFSEAGSRWPAPIWAAPVSLVTHMLLHGDFFHLLINSAWLLAVGSPIARRMSAMRFLAFTALCGVGGAATFLAFHIGLDQPMVGASGAISGLMAAVFRLMFAAESPYDRQVLREEPAAAPRLSLAATFTNRTSLTAIVVWVVINFVFAYGFGSRYSAGGIAWEAHLGGFVAGLLAFAWFDQGRPPRDAQ